MIPTIETIVEDLLSGKITKPQAIAWLHQRAADAHRELRDDFAAMALNGLQGRDWSHMTDDAEIVKTWATSSYAVADAMLKARES